MEAGGPPGMVDGGIRGWCSRRQIRDQPVGAGRNADRLGLVLAHLHGRQIGLQHGIRLRQVGRERRCSADVGMAMSCRLRRRRRAVDRQAGDRGIDLGIEAGSQDVVRSAPAGWRCPGRRTRRRRHPGYPARSPPGPARRAPMPRCCPPRSHSHPGRCRAAHRSWRRSTGSRVSAVCATDIRPVAASTLFCQVCRLAICGSQSRATPAHRYPDRHRCRRPGRCSPDW